MDITRKIVKDSGITTMMVTHNLKHALENGNRLFMMHRGQILFDVQGEEKKKLDNARLMALFDKAHVTDELSDRTLFA